MGGTLSYWRRELAAKAAFGTEMPAPASDLASALLPQQEISTTPRKHSAAAAAAAAAKASIEQ
jgi:hypothetical protein